MAHLADSQAFCFARYLIFIKTLWFSSKQYLDAKQFVKQTEAMKENRTISIKFLIIFEYCLIKNINSVHLKR